MLDSSFMPLFLVEDFVIAFKSNDPKGGTPKKLPSFDPLAIFLWELKFREHARP